MIVSQKPLLVLLFSYKMFEQGNVGCCFFALVLTIFMSPLLILNLLMEILLNVRCSFKGRIYYNNTTITERSGNVKTREAET